MTDAQQPTQAFKAFVDASVRACISREAGAINAFIDWSSSERMHVALFLVVHLRA